MTTLIKSLNIGLGVEPMICHGNNKYLVAWKSSDNMLNARAFSTDTFNPLTLLTQQGPVLDKTDKIICIRYWSTYNLFVIGILSEVLDKILLLSEYGEYQGYLNIVKNTCKQLDDISNLINVFTYDDHLLIFKYCRNTFSTCLYKWFPSSDKCNDIFDLAHTFDTITSPYILKNANEITILWNHLNNLHVTCYDIIERKCHTSNLVRLKAKFITADIVNESLIVYGRHETFLQAIKMNKIHNRWGSPKHGIIDHNNWFFDESVCGTNNSYFLLHTRPKYNTMFSCQVQQFSSDTCVAMYPPIELASDSKTTHCKCAFNKETLFIVFTCNDVNIHGMILHV